MSRELGSRWSLPNSWVWTKLSALGDIIGGGTPSTKEPTYWTDEINWISPSDLTGHSAKTIKRGTKSISKNGLTNSSAKVMPAGSVHFSTRAPIGYIVISSEPLATNQGFKSLVPAPGIFNAYVYYYLIASRDYARKRASGTTFLELSGKAFGDLAIPLAPAAMQHKIVTKIEELFSELDKGIESLKAARAKLEIYRQAVLKHAFEGKLTAEWREENRDKLETAGQLLAHNKQMWEARYEKQLQEWKAAVKKWEKGGKSGKRPARLMRPTEVVPLEGKIREALPAIPKCWEWLKLKHIGRIETGTTPSTKIRENYGGSLPFIKPTDLDQGGHVRTARDHLSQLGEESARVIPAGSTLVTCIGATIGKTGFAVTQCATNQQINSVSPCVEFEPRFIYLQMVAPFLNRKIKTDASATTLPILNKSKFGELPFVLCSLPEQLELVWIVEEGIVAIERSEREIDSNLNQVETLRQSILKKAFSGELVPHDPHDESASVLLERIKAVKSARSQVNKRTKRRREKATA